MTSVVDTSVKYFHHEMPGAPVLTGAAGTLVALLDACLKDGFDTKSVASLVVAGGVATVTWVGTHSALSEAVIVVAGVTGSLTALNGEQKVVTKPNGTSLTFATAAADGAATGTITIKMAPLGWLKPFAGTNLAAYKSADVASAGHLLRIDDTATTFARVRGFEAMTDVSTGTGPFPTDAQISGGGYWPKSTAAGSTAIPWQIVGDGRMFYIAIAPARPVGAQYLLQTLRGFGDPLPLKPGGDPYATVLPCSAVTSIENMWDADFSSQSGSLWQARSYTGLGGSYAAVTRAYTGTNNYSGYTATLGSFPNVIDGSLYMSRKYLTDATTLQPRADLPGLFHIPQSLVYDTIKYKDIVPGSGSFAGRKLMAIGGAANVAMNSAVIAANTNAIVLLLDVTGPWR